MIKWGGILWSIHPLFVMVMLASALTGYFMELLVLFVIVLVHELGHVAAAKGFGWRVKEVKLLPFGGVAEVEEAAGVSAKEDVIVALAGPLQNGWMALAAWGLGQLGLWHSEWASYVVEANLMIALFNLLPIHPLDGGKLLHALLGSICQYYKALLWTARLGMLCSCLMIAAAVIPFLLEESTVQLNLLVVGIFLFASNRAYSRNVPFLFLRFLTHRERMTNRAMEAGKKATHLVVNGSQSLMSVARLFKRESFHVVYVSERDGNSLKMLPENMIVRSCLSGLGPHRAVSELLL